MVLPEGVGYDRASGTMGGLDDLFEHVPVAGYAFRAADEEFVLEQVNAAGRSRNPHVEVLLGKPMAALYRDQPAIGEAARRCVAEQRPLVLEQPVRRYDRTEATLNLRLTLVPLGPEHLALFLEDVPSQRVAQIALSESESRYRSLVAALPDAVLLRGADGRVLACNDVAVRVLGAEREADLLGETRVIPPGVTVRTEGGEFVPHDALPDQAVLTTGRSAVAAVYSLEQDGRTRWLRVAAEPVRSATGAVTGSAAILTDVTERLVAQRALAESAARLDLAMVGARMGVWELDPGADKGRWSPNLDDLFLLHARGRGVDGFLERVHPEDHGKVQGVLEELVAGRQTSVELDARLIGSDGVARWARLRGQVQREGARARVVGTVMDVTEQHRLEDELRRASRLESVGRLAGGVAHDFNNMLAAILGALELLEARCPAGLSDDLMTIRHASLRARDLTRQLLAFARRQPAELRVVELGALVQHVDRMLRPLVGGDVELVIEYGARAFVRADPALLEQVLVNLVVNARDAMPGGGRLEVRVGRRTLPPGGELSGEVAALQVLDSGTGIDEATRAHLFEPFFSTKGHGTGLGLASSYGIVRQHGGDITVESTPGIGASFSVLLPLVAEAPPDEREATPVPASAGEGAVLVVDDDELVRGTAARLLESLGYRAVVAGDAAEALACAAARATPFDLLLCDVAMPGRSGPSIARELRERYPGLQVVFVSGHPGGGQAELAGAAFLQKPYGRADLGAKLAEVRRAARRS